MDNARVDCRTLELEETKTELTDEGSDAEDFPMPLQRKSTILNYNTVDIAIESCVEETGVNMREAALRELITTEVTYVENLNILLNEFIEPIFEKELIPLKYKVKILSNIPSLFQFHQIFLKELQTAVSIPKVFASEQTDYFKLYLTYVDEYPSVIDVMSLFRTNRGLQRYLSNKRKTEKKALTNYLILPIQRIPRYLLLLQQIQKQTQLNHSESDDLSIAVRKIQTIANFINDRKRVIDNQSQCLQVQQSISDLNQPIVAPHRKFIGEYLFRKNKNDRDRIFFLFNDILIICNAKLRLKSIVELRTAEIKITNFEFTLYTATKATVYIDVSKSENVVDFEKEFIKARLSVWDGDVSRLSRSGNIMLRELMKQNDVSQSKNYEKQATLLRRMQLSSQRSTLTLFGGAQLLSQESIPLSFSFPDSDVSP